MSLFAATHLLEAAPTASGNPAFSALIWWLVPIFAVSGAIIYVIWVSRFKEKFQNETNRSVNSFQSFQRSFTGSAPSAGLGGTLPLAGSVRQLLPEPPPVLGTPGTRSTPGTKSTRNDDESDPLHNS